MKAKTFWLSVFATTCASLATLASLPHEKYLRYQALDIGTYAKARWIYERIHFDATPIDVAFFGTSHTLNGIDSKIVANELDARLGDAVHVTNFAMPHFGRDMHLTLIGELLRARKPGAIVIEVRESEARDGHPAVHYLADGMDLVRAPLLVNLRYFGNLARLPYRQAHLFLKSGFPRLFGAQTTFDSRQYAGAHLNFALEWPRGGRRDAFKTQDELAQLRKESMRKHGGKLDRTSALKTLVYYNASYTNLRRAVEIAQDAGVEVFLLYLPDYGSRPQPVDVAVYEPLAPIIYLKRESLYTGDIWFDLGHLNADGAERISREVAAHLAGLLPGRCCT